MRLAIVFVLTALGFAIYLADAEPLTVDTNVAINIQNPPRAEAKPMTQRAAARVKPDQKGSGGKNPFEEGTFAPTNKG